jgi:predicted RNA binding protein YcfA (HicA-like mRNA interferase family)
MKTSEFVRSLKKQGIKFYRHGARHDTYINPENGKKSELPRHRSQEIGTKKKEKILKDLGLK